METLIVTDPWEDDKLDYKKIGTAFTNLVRERLIKEAEREGKAILAECERVRVTLRRSIRYEYTALRSGTSELPGLLDRAERLAVDGLESSEAIQHRAFPRPYMPLGVEKACPAIRFR